MATANDGSGPITVLDPAGDIILSIDGPDFKSRLLSSSHVLRLSSPVFKRMLSPGFREGDALQAARLAGNAEPLTIPLTEDFPKAMIKLLRHLHHTDPEELDRCTLEQTAEVAIQADKYECQNIVHFWVESRVSKAVQKKDPSHDDLICILILITKCSKVPSYHSGFSFIHWHMTSDFASNAVNSGWYEHLYNDCIASLVIKSQAKLCAIQASVYQIQSSLALNSKDLCHNGKYCGQASRLTNFFESLENAGLWPDPMVFRKDSLRHVSHKLSQARAFSEHGCSPGFPLTKELDTIVKNTRRVLVSETSEGGCTVKDVERLEPFLYEMMSALQNVSKQLQ